MTKLPYRNILIHLLGWILFLSLPIAFMSGHASLAEVFIMLTSGAYFLFCLSYFSTFYITHLFLIPRFYLQKKFFSFFIGIVLLLVAIFFIRPYENLLHAEHTVFKKHGKSSFHPGAPPHGDRISGEHPGPPPGGPPPGGGRLIDITSMYLFFTVIAGAMIIQLNDKWRKIEQRVIQAETERAQAEADKVSAELSFLKAQINPHFLFNTLNNIYSLAVIKSDQTADSIVKLSNIMRYLTEDVSKDLVPLEQEVKTISNYVHLQLLRLGRKFEVDLTVIGDLKGKSVPPLILMTFVENAFKYGVSRTDPHPITIRVNAHESIIFFYVENKISESRKNLEQNSTTIGVSNTRKRLDHLYPNKHSLLIDNSDVFYKVTLTINVK